MFCKEHIKVILILDVVIDNDVKEVQYNYNYPC